MFFLVLDASTHKMALSDDVFRFVFLVGFSSMGSQLAMYGFFVHLWVVTSCDECVIKKSLIQSYLIIMTGFWLATALGGFVFALRACRESAQQGKPDNAEVKQ